MLYRGLILILFSVLSINLNAQVMSNRPIAPSYSSPATTVLSGRIAVEGASALPPDRTTVILECNDQERARAFSDMKGNFILNVSVSERSGLASAGNTLGVVGDQEWSNCGVYGELSGYQSEKIRLFGTTSRGMVQIGTVMLHPMRAAPGAMISVTSLAAPEKAKDAMEKGKEQEKKGRWAAAAGYFKKALSVYPRYALAWVELGRMQIRQNDFQEAEHSLQEAVSHDSGLLPAYAELARVAAVQKQWKELADVTARVLQTAPDSSPEFWFLNSAANYNLGKVRDAQTSIERALRTDTQHQVPQAEYLYGVILAANKDFKSAADHVSVYLQLKPQAKDAARAKQLLAECQKLAGEQAPH
jgi:tetratricopeptide (TPR) repeat protein